MMLIKSLIKDFLAWCAVALGALSAIAPHWSGLMEFLKLDGKTTEYEGVVVALILLIVRAFTLSKQLPPPKI
jgi:hypothetical protein